MKKILLFLFALMPALAFAQSPQEKEGLKGILMQPGAGGQPNYIHLGFDSEPDWESSGWIDKLKSDGVISIFNMPNPILFSIILNDNENIGGVLDFTKIKDIAAISIKGTSVSGINISGLAKLTTLYCENTNLTLETMPAPEDIPPYNTVKYAPLNTIEGGISAGWQIDLSAQNRNGKTTYKWYADGDLNNELTNITVTEAGKFNIPKKYGDQTLVCRMTNGDYPQFAANPLTYRVTMPAPDYHADDRAALQAFLIQESAVEGKKNYEHLGFTTEPDFANEEWVAKLDQMTWHETSPKRLKYIKFPYASTDLAGSLDATSCAQLAEITISNTKINELLVDGLQHLTYINADNAPISTLNLTDLPALKTLIVSNTTISQLNLSNLGNLEYLNCSGNSLITSLDASSLTKLQGLRCERTSTSQLLLPETTSLKDVRCRYTNLTLETLPEVKEQYETYLYSPLSEIDGGTVTDGKVDLSAQNRNGKTTYKWYKQTDLNNELTGITTTDGKFEIPAKYGGQSLVCRMTNTDFPEFATRPLVYKVQVTHAYHAEDKAALQAFLMQDAEDGKKNYEHLGFTALPDWTTEEWVSSVTGITWNNEIPKRLKTISWSAANLKGSLDLRNCTMLEKVACSNTKVNELLVSGLQNLTSIISQYVPISALDLTGVPNLSTLTIIGTNVSQLDVSNLTGLEMLYCSSTPMSELNVGNLVNLKYLDVSNTTISVLDVANLTNLEWLYCYNTPISMLETGNLTNLTRLSCHTTQISRLDVSNLTALTELQCSYTNLTLETLPEIKTQYTTCYYAPQNRMDGGTITDGTVDLSAQNRNSHTTYEWYIDGNTTNELTDIIGTGGVFTIPAKYGGKTLVCHMTNTDFPGFTTAKPLVYKVDVAYAYHADDKAALQAFLIQDAADGQKNYNHLGFATEPDWTSEEWVGSVTGVTWNTETPKHISQINWTNKSDLKGSFDARNLVKLNMLYCGNTKINALDVSGLSEFITLYCNNTDMRDLKLTGASSLTVFNCSNTPISELDLTGLSNLHYLYCSNTAISELNVSGATTLTLLDCSSTAISELDVTRINTLETLDCSNTKLTLATLPASTGVPYASYYTYAPLNEIDGGTTEGEVDLSAQNRNGNTDYRWYMDGDLSNELDDITGINGVFTIPAKYAKATLVCLMTNSGFPLFDSDPLSYKVQVSPIVSVAEEKISAERVYISEGQLCVDAENGGVLQVYDMAGRLYLATKVSAGSTNIEMENGIYIVKFNGVTEKIVIKK